MDTWAKQNRWSLRVISPWVLLVYYRIKSPLPSQVGHAPIRLIRLMRVDHTGLRRSYSVPFTEFGAHKEEEGVYNSQGRKKTNRSTGLEAQGTHASSNKKKKSDSDSWRTCSWSDPDFDLI